MADNIIKLAAAVLDAALAWEGAWNDIFAYPHGFSHEEQALINAIRAYRAAKETP